MGETSLNGWAAIQDEGDPRLRWIKVPGTGKSVCVRKEAAPLFACFLAEVNRLLIPLDGGPLDGWEYRQARNANALSNHSSGTAVDFRYDVLLADNEKHWPDSKHAIMHKLMDKYVTSKGKRVFGWGGDWSRARDEMHVELLQSWSPGSQGEDCTLADVQDVIKRLGIKDDGTQTLVGKVVGVLPAPKPKPTAHQIHINKLIRESKTRKLTPHEQHELHMALTGQKPTPLPLGSGPVWAKSFLASQGLSGDALRIAWTIIGRETQWDPKQVYPAGDHDWGSKYPPFDVGLWQNNSTSMEELKALFGRDADMRVLLDPVKATALAKVVSKDWTDWRAWGIGSVGPDGTVRFDWSWYPQPWLDKPIGSRTQRQVSEADFLTVWKQWQ